jgi:TonB family protein
MVRASYLLAVGAAFIGLTSGCTSDSKFANEWPAATNAKLAASEQQGHTGQSRYHEKLLRLWQDKPEYLALIDNQPPKRMRVISAVTPEYPFALQAWHVNGQVVVSFIVGTDGHTEDARVVESTDSRFDESALAAIKGFLFVPASGSDGPTRSMATVPFNYAWFAVAPAEPVKSPASSPGSTTIPASAPR